MEDRNSMNKAVFIDKDGTLIHDVPYNVDPDLIRFQEGAIEGMKLLKEKGFMLIMVSNQSGVARGLFTEDSLSVVMEHIQRELGRANVSFDAFYFCPHHPCGIVEKYSINCDCRKPGPGMILQAARDFNIDVTRSWMIGDILHDVEAGNRAGCKTILINNGSETEWKRGTFRKPDFIAGSIEDAVDLIISSESILC